MTFLKDIEVGDMVYITNIKSKGWSDVISTTEYTFTISGYREFHKINGELLESNTNYLPIAIGLLKKDTK